MASPTDFFVWLRRQFIIALAADDELFARLTLKGGNAITLLHRIGNRTSLDIDYALREEVDPDELSRRVIDCLISRMREKGYHVFDARFSERPENAVDPRFSGYRIKFKILSIARWNELAGDMSRARRSALTNLPEDGRSGQTFVIEISRLEAVPEFVELPVDEGFTVRVYTVQLLAAEKLRALCQQMPEYGIRGRPTRRPRDFYDLHALVTEAGVDVGSQQFSDLLAVVFAAKDVPVSLVERIARSTGFHGEAWAEVQNMIPANRSRDFAFYASSVESELKRLIPRLLGRPPAGSI